MTRQLCVFGAMDDCIEFSGIKGCDEFYTSAPSSSHYAGRFAVLSPSEGINAGTNEPLGLYIHVLYDGSWSFAVSAGIEEYMPDWEIKRTWGEDCEYSETLCITVPDDAELIRLK